MSLVRGIKRTMLHIPWPYSSLVDYLNLFFQFRKFVRAQPDAKRFPDRATYFRHLHDTYIQGQPIDYLEFGVYQGHSLRAWSEMNRHPASRFFGFDSFEGLPEDWTGGMKKGTFDQKGQIPHFDDARVRCIKGWFQHSLPGFLEEYRPGHRLVVHLDADLYSSSLYCLTMLHRFLAPGTLVMFDEFSSVTHEYRAWQEYLGAYMREAKGLAYVEKTWDQACFEIVR